MESFQLKLPYGLIYEMVEMILSFISFDTKCFLEKTL